MTTQDGEEFPAGQRLMDTNVEDESSVDRGSEDEVFNEAEDGPVEDNDESGDVPYPLTLVRRHPAGLRVVNIDRDTCGCIMMSTLRDGTKSPTVCTKPVTICNRHSPRQRQTRSVQGTGTLLVETDANTGLKSEYPPGRPSGGLCTAVDSDTDSSSMVEDVTPSKTKRRASGRRVGTPEGFFNERDPTSAINNNILTTNTNDSRSSHSPVGRKKTGKPKGGSPASLQTSLSKASFNPIIGMENEFGQRRLVFSSDEQVARQNEEYDPIESFSSKITAAEWLSLAPNTIGLKQPPRKLKSASRTRKSGRNNGGNGGVSILRQPKYPASSNGRTQYTREELLANRVAKKKKENKKKKEKKKSHRSKAKVDFSDSENFPSDSSASTRSRVTVDPDPDSDPDSSESESDSSASTSSSESSRDTSSLFDFPDSISVSSSSSSSSSSDDSSRDSDSTTEAKKKRKKKKKKKKKKTRKDSKLERKIAKGRQAVLKLQNEQAKRRGAKSISIWKPDKSRGKSGSVFGCKISNTPKITDLLYPAGSSGEEFPSTMLDVCSLGSNKGMYNTDEQSSTATELVDSFRAMRSKALPRVCKQNTTYNRINREGLPYFVTGDAEHFHSLVQVIHEEWEGMLEQQSAMVVEYLTLRQWHHKEASEFAETGGFPSLILLIKGLYFDLLLKLQRQITLYGMEDGPFRPTFDYHAKKLMQIRRSAVNLPKMYLAQYLFLRDSKLDNFEHHRMYHGMWGKLKEVDAKADYCMLPVQRDTRRVLPPVKDEKKEEVRCTHCRSVELHRAFKPLVAPGGVCPLHELHTTKAKKVARLIMVAFKADAATTSIGRTYIQPFIDTSNETP